MSGPRDMYARLGLAADASQREINRAYRRLARRLHPDTAGAEAADRDRLQQVVEAYAILSDPDRRRAYDEVDGRRRARHAVAACDVCHGRAVIERGCERCRMKGYVLTDGPWLREQRLCPLCHGRGHLTAPCGACASTGRAAP